ncbi:MAG: ATP-binding cassette domain-containing protein, partial [Bacteroidaceae bacterium]|nr:ATP-binding cassette domain-containing protein [Bacteroidaceae bacterium]
SFCHSCCQSWAACISLRRIGSCTSRSRTDKPAILPCRGAQKEQLRDQLYTMFHLDILLDKQIILLSSGELRKFQLTKTLLTNPRVVIMDNPFIGLDAQTREQLTELLTNLAANVKIMFILVLSKTDNIPPFITHVIPVEPGRDVREKISRDEYYATYNQKFENLLSDKKKEAIKNYPYKDSTSIAHLNEVVNFNNVCIKYGERTILKDLNWVVRRGEKWALSGENGAGKSTLLSLVCADNPQSYACDITLFGHKRGTGESIWDIKKYIGYVSPEMHRAYLKDVPAIEIVASGMSDFSSLYRKPKAEDLPTCDFWMDIFGIKHLKDTTFLKLSSGEQRLVLLARAFVRDPELLILDEPLHGLDMRNRRLVKEIINEFCKRSDKTMIMVTHYKSEYPECITNEIFLRKNR